MLKLSDKQVADNWERLRQLEGCALYESVRSGSKTCLAEVDDLFYFFKNQIWKNSFRNPVFRSDHDKRLGELEQLVNQVSLEIEQDTEEQMRLVQESDQVGKRAIDLLLPPSPAVYDTIYRQLDTLKAFRGLLDVSSLHNEALTEHLNESRKQFQQLYIPTATVISVASLVSMYSVNPLYFMLGVGGLVLVGYVSIASQEHTPRVYSALRARAERFDEFLSSYSK